MKCRACVVSVAALAASVLIVAEARQGPVFRSEVNYIEIVASVTNKNGEFVKGLTAADFEVREQGKREAIDSFSFVELPAGTGVSVAAPAAYRPGMSAADRQADARVYLIYLNGATAGNTPLVRRLATEFVRGYLQPGDRAAIWDAQYPARSVVFTGDKVALQADIEPYTGVASAYDLPFAFGCRPGTAWRGEAGEQEQCQAALREPYGNLSKAIDWFNGIQGRRKSMVLFTGGWLGPTDPSTRADITLYAVDVRGLVALDYQALSGTRTSGSAAAAAVGDNLSQLSASTDGLWALADRTGGFAIINYNDFKPGFQRIVEANSQYYVLGYASSYARRDRVFRELDVKVTRPGVQVHARRGYFARP